jgi:alpha/beta hydrolase fold
MVDLYLIRPPPAALHQPVNPKHIIVMGDSAGGGLSLALLQVIQDSGLPAPAGGVLVSPWCDMSHSFPSIHENTDSVRVSFLTWRSCSQFSKDVIPYYGLSLHKPSTLWPPPPEGITNKVHETLKNRIRGVVRMDANGRLKRSPERG